MDEEEGGGGGGVLVALIKSRPFGGDPGIEQVQYSWHEKVQYILA